MVACPRGTSSFSLMLHMSLVVLWAVHIHLPDVADESSGHIGRSTSSWHLLPRGGMSSWHLLVVACPRGTSSWHLLMACPRCSPSPPYPSPVSSPVTTRGAQGLQERHQKQCIFQCSNRAPLTVCTGGADPTAPRLGCSSSTMASQLSYARCRTHLIVIFSN